MVMEGVQEDMGEGSMLCTDHPYKNNIPGGICALCLQEKLGKLVSSSFPIAVFPSSSSSTSPSFRSESLSISTSNSVSVPPPHKINLSSSSSNIVHNDCHYHHYSSKRSRILYLLSQKKKKKKDLNIIDGGASDRNSSSMVFKRSKSTASTTPRRGLHHFLGGVDNVDELSPHKRGFWSFLYLPKNYSKKPISSNSLGASTAAADGSFSRPNKEEGVVVEENESPDQASSDRKVSRSRSVGCGSRSFSGDFFERISTGFGDCTLRRVESQREGKPKAAGAVRRGGAAQDCIKERVKCGGLFSGFTITSSSSSSSSSSYWISTAAPAPAPGNLAHGRSKSWGWAFASPMRALSKTSGRKEPSNKNPTPNLAAIPSLLAVRT